MLAQIMSRSIVTDDQFLIDNLAYRIQQYHHKASVNIGAGNVNAQILTIQPTQKFPEKDAITGALKRFGMLDQSYRTTSVLVEYDPCTEGQSDINRYYLQELVDLMRPKMVIACGQEVTSFLLKRKIRNFDRYRGKKIKPEGLKMPDTYAIMNPMDYGYSRAPDHLKTEGKKEWEKLSSIYEKLTKN